MVILKILGWLLLALFISVALLTAWLWPRSSYLPAVAPAFAAERMFDEPIIRVDMSPRLQALAEEEGYININGPTLIRVPAWVENPLGRYYLYFAHHKGDHIRLAYADTVTGPWTIHDAGALALADSMFPVTLGSRPDLNATVSALWQNYSIYVARDLIRMMYRSVVSDQAERQRRGITTAANARPHIASPEIFVDEPGQRLVMYYHGLDADGGQYTRAAVSADGLQFTPQPALVRNNYLRLFQRNGFYYGLTMPGVLYRSSDPLEGFNPRDQLLFEHDMRHAGLLLEGDNLYVFWSRVGDTPESILLSEVDLSSTDWNDWQATTPVVVLAPELPWEGGDMPLQSSMRGELELSARELRDPHVFVDEDGSRYLLYTGAAEQAIGLARLHDLRDAAAPMTSKDWPVHGLNAAEQRHSLLTQVNRANVSDLKLHWSYSLGSKRGVEATPIVVDGTLYTTSSWSVVHALDAKTGRLLWRYDPEVPGETARKACCDVVNRGVAVVGDRLFLATLDGRLQALDRHDGSVLWSVMTADPDQAYTITGAPRAVKDMVVIGNGGAELGVRGYVSAYSIADGSLRWRFYTVPGDPALPDEHPELTLARQTWSVDSQWESGLGGTVWDSMAYDADLNLLYVGTGNAVNYNRSQRSPGGGDNLFLSSILALNPDSGSLVWFYQTTPAESWDYTATQQMILAELDIAGRERSVIMQAPKNGFFYILDRATGELLSAEPYTPMNWASHVDMSSGRPVETTTANWFDMPSSNKPRFIKPTIAGGHNWQPMAYDPERKLVYIPTRDEAYPFFVDPEFTLRHWAFNTGENFPALEADFRDLPIRQCTPTQLTAWDPRRESVAWQVEMDSLISAGVLSTAGGLVFQGRGDAHFLAYDADSGDELWQVPVNTPIVAPPITYAVDGVQYLAVSTGMGGGGLAFTPAPYQNNGYLLVFSLEGSAELPPRVARQERQLQLPEELLGRLQDSAELAAVEKGRITYSRYCLVCHGAGAVNPGALPDLRFADSNTHLDWSGIVLGGLRQAKGMASFADSLSIEDADNIHLYVVSRALETQRWSNRLVRALTEQICVPSGWLAD